MITNSNNVRTHSVTWRKTHRLESLLHATNDIEAKTLAAQRDTRVSLAFGFPSLSLSHRVSQNPIGGLQSSPTGTNWLITD